MVHDAYLTVLGRGMVEVNFKKQDIILLKAWDIWKQRDLKDLPAIYFTIKFTVSQQPSTLKEEGCQCAAVLCTNSRKQLKKGQNWYLTAH